MIRSAKKEAEQKERYAHYEQMREQRNQNASDPVKQETQAEKRCKRALLEVLEVILKQEEAAEIAAEKFPPELLDQSPLSIAVNEVIQAKMLEEWTEAPARIIARLEPEGLIGEELSRILMTDPSDESVEGEKKESKGLTKKEKAALLQLLTEDANVIREYRINQRMEQLMERFARSAPDDPVRGDLIRELGELTKERASLRRA